MRLLAFISLLVLCAACGSTKKNASEISQNKLTGTWIPVKQEVGGTLLPKATVENQKLILTDSTYTVIAESIDKGVVKYHDDKIDIYGTQGTNAGKHYTAIHKFENGQLVICYNLAGDSYPATFETKGKPMYFLSVFKKE